VSCVGTADGVDAGRAGGVAVGLDPALALRPGRFDPIALWCVWLARRAALPLLWLGLVVALAGGELDKLDPQRFANMAELFDALLSPLAVVVLSLVARVASSVLAWLLASPLAYTAAADAARRPLWKVRGVSVWIDRYYLTRALRAWRWTAPVRALAAERLGPIAPRLRLLDLALVVANPALFVVAVVAIAVNGSTLADAASGTFAAAAVALPVVHRGAADCSTIDAEARHGAVDCR
jgi:hypothetical protein